METSAETQKPTQPRGPTYNAHLQHSKFPAFQEDRMERETRRISYARMDAAGKPLSSCS
jgi:hypothetical protein